MIDMTDKDFIYKFDSGIDFSADEMQEICSGIIGYSSGGSDDGSGNCTSTFQVEGRWFRVYWTEKLINGEIIIDYSLARVREMQSMYDYIMSLNIHDLAEYLRNFGAYCKTRTDEISLCEIKSMLAEYREDCK